MAVNGLLLVLGGWIYRCRMIGIFCHHFLTIFLLASVIVTYRYRNREQGQLAALSLMPSKTSSDTEYDLGWTYADDANFIDKFFIFEIITLIVIRRLFKDLSELKLSTNWFEIKNDLQFTFDIIASVVMFYLLYLFYKQSKPKHSETQKVITSNIDEADVRTGL